MSATEPIESVRMSAQRRRRLRVLGSSLGVQAGLVLVCAIILVPCFFLVLGSFKSVEEFFADPFGLPVSFDLTNYRDAWREANLATAFRNSVIVTSVSVLLSTAAACIASYAIARIKFIGSTFLLLLLVSGLLIPPQLIVLGVFIEMKELGLLGTVWPLILMYSALGIPLGVLILTRFFRALPRELSEAAAIDGAGTWRQFLQITLPLARAPVFTVVLLNGVFFWNDFFIPLVFATDESLQTLPLAVQRFYGTYATEYGLVFAGVVMSSIPVLIIYVLMTGRFVRGITAGSLKG